MTGDTGKIMEAFAAIAEKRLVETGECGSFFIASAGDGAPMMIPTPWADEGEKLVYLRALRSLFAEKGVVRYALVSEAWLAEIDPRTQPELIDVTPSEREDRQEVVLVALVEKNKPPAVAMWSIERSADGAASLKRRDGFDAGGMLEGRMLGLLQ